MNRSRIYPPAFKECAIRAIAGGIPVTQLAKALGVHFTTLHGWKRASDGEPVKRPRIISHPPLASDGTLEAVFKDFLSKNKGHLLRLLEVQH